MKLPEEVSLLVIGLGSEYRRDDAVGLRVAQRLRGLLPDEVRVWPNANDPIALWEACKGALGAILIDAACSSTHPGTVHRFDARRRPLPGDFFRSSTHSLNLGAVIELGRALHQLPPHLVVYAIEGRDFDFGFGLSPEVEDAVPDVLERVRHEIEQIRAADPSVPQREAISHIPFAGDKQEPAKEGA